MDFRPISKIENENKDLQAHLEKIQQKRSKSITISKKTSYKPMKPKVFRPENKKFEQIGSVLSEHEKHEETRRKNTLANQKIVEEKKMLECSFKPTINLISQEIVKNSSTYVPITKRAEYDVETVKYVNERQASYEKSKRDNVNGGNIEQKNTKPNYENFKNAGNSQVIDSQDQDIKA